MTLPPRFQKLKELEEKVTPEPWTFDWELWSDIVQDDPDTALGTEFLEFITEARNQVPDLLKALEIAMKALRSIRLDGELCWVSEEDYIDKITHAHKALEQIEKLGANE